MAPLIKYQSQNRRFDADRYAQQWREQLEQLKQIKQRNPNPQQAPAEERDQARLASTMTVEQIDGLMADVGNVHDAQGRSAFERRVLDNVYAASPGESREDARAVLGGLMNEMARTAVEDAGGAATSPELAQHAAQIEQRVSEQTGNNWFGQDDLNHFSENIAAIDGIPGRVQGASENLNAMKQLFPELQRIAQNSPGVQQYLDAVNADSGSTQSRQVPQDALASLSPEDRQKVTDFAERNNLFWENSDGALLEGKSNLDFRDPTQVGGANAGNASTATPSRYEQRRGADPIARNNYTRNIAADVAERPLISANSKRFSVDDLHSLQDELGLPHTDTYDEATRSKVVELQTAAGLKPDGIVGNATWTEILTGGATRGRHGTAGLRGEPAAQLPAV